MQKRFLLTWKYFGWFTVGSGILIYGFGLVGYDFDFSFERSINNTKVTYQTLGLLFIFLGTPMLVIRSILKKYDPQYAKNN